MSEEIIVLNFVLIFVKQNLNILFVSLRFLSIHVNDY